MKIEAEKIQLGPINLDSIRLSGHIVGVNQNSILRTEPWQLEALQMMKESASIQDIVNGFLSQGKLISFLSLRNLLSFLVEEEIILNPSIIEYMHGHKPTASPPKSFLARLFDSDVENDNAPPASLTERITKIPFMRSLSRDLVNFFLTHMRVIETPAKTQVCQMGQIQRSLFCLLEGQASVFKNDKNGRLVKVTTLDDGSIFGEVGFFLGQPRTADVITDTDSLIVKFKYVPEIFESLIKKEKAQQMQKRFWLIHGLLHSSLFSELPDDCFDALIFAGSLREYPQQKVVIAEGTVAQNFYVVVQGALQVSQNGRPIRKLSQGDCFGEVALMLNRGIRTATVQTLNDTILLEISVEKFYSLLAENLFLACEFEKLSLSRIRHDQEQIK